MNSIDLPSYPILANIPVQDFAYSAPGTVAEAVKLLAQAGGKARVLAGGTDILVQLRERLRSAELVVDVKRIPELIDIRAMPSGGWRIGAATPCYQIYEHADLKKQYPGLVDAAHIIGGWQIQSRASLGGNLCNASPAGDSIPPLVAYGAVCHIAGPGVTRTLPAAEFCVSPGKNALASGELLVAIELPPQPKRSGCAYERFIPRNEMDIAVAGAASWVRLNDAGDRMEEARITLAAVAPKPAVASDAAQWLAGQAVCDATFAQAGELAKKAASPIDDMRGTREFRLHLVGVLVKRTLAKAVERTRT